MNKEKKFENFQELHEDGAHYEVSVYGYGDPNELKQRIKAAYKADEVLLFTWNPNTWKIRIATRLNMHIEIDPDAKNKNMCGWINFKGHGVFSFYSYFPEEYRNKIPYIENALKNFLNS